MTETYQYTKAFTQSYRLSDNLARQQNTNRVAIAEILKMALRTSNAHDAAVRQQLDEEDYVIKSHQTWVITNNQLELFEWPLVNQMIDIQTKIVEANRFFVVRSFEVSHQGQLLIQIYMQFAAIDFETRKMARLQLSSIDSIVNEQAPIVFSKFNIEAERSSDFEQKYEIQATDIDENQHVNNLVYFRWGYDALPDEFKQEYHLQKIELKYGSELLPEHQVVVKTYISVNNVVQTEQVIYNETLDKQACHIRMTWIKE
ncbi:hypothetical protein JXA27_07525 [Aerococcaceae bacterium zg-B36]|uniref:acyl-[acyl-carrier-protein] thioesterase n=1 Tax=Aerococcaceae bacterium zg-252 TaxID=2796928 RepID=UPI001BD80922|nr:hypothetical protein [Aerococcaceae bacterium zg-B36]